MVNCGTESQKVLIAFQSASVVIKTRLTIDGPSTGIIWLQANPEHLGPIPLIALPIKDSNFSVDTLHPLVALGVHTGKFRNARLLVDGESIAKKTWSIEKQSPNALPVLETLGDSLWVTDTGTESTGLPAVWFDPGNIQPESEALPDDWWLRFDYITRGALNSLAELEEHLRQLLPGCFKWRLEDISAARGAAFFTPDEDNLALALIPRATEVIVALDLNLPTESLQILLLHAIAHLTLGHIRPGDQYGHWDTVKTVTDTKPHRLWDC